ncbi:P1 family peptidase [Hyphococcus sp. DH-69]|uniref:P1 family peptidase n=1 Tax=Hyphococcus formosus TaxID=3143534 RepID=UPI00398B5072
MNRRELLGSLVSVSTAGLAVTSGGVSIAANTLGGQKTGPRNLITDVAGLKVGQSQDKKVQTGVTVIVPDSPAVAAVDVRGGGPATRETDALAPHNLVQEVDAIVLSGGSVYGMASADGVASWFGARNRGFSMGNTPGVPPSPIVPTACLYDLANGGNKNWGENPPYRKLGVKALEAASEEFDLGTVGAGFGAMSGGIKGGLGSASTVTADGHTVGAIVAVNSLGSVIAPGTKQFWAAPVEIGKEFGGLGTSELHANPEDYGYALGQAKPRANTTIACIATDVALSRVEMQRIAVMAQDGMARAIRPIHAPFDGDVLFALSTGHHEASGDMRRSVLTMRLGAIAADTLARAIARAVYEATALPGSEPKPAWRDLG